MTLINHFNFSTPISGGSVKSQDPLSEDAGSMADGFQRALLEMGPQSEFHWPRSIAKFSGPNPAAIPEAASVNARVFGPIEEAEGTDPSLATSVFPTLTLIKQSTPMPFNAGWRTTQKVQEIPTSVSPPVARNGAEFAAPWTAGFQSGMGDRATTSQPSGRQEATSAVGKLEIFKGPFPAEHLETVGRPGPVERSHTAIPAVVTAPVLLTHFGEVPIGPQLADAVEHQALTARLQTPSSGHSIVDSSAKPTETILSKTPAVENRTEPPADRNELVRPVVGAEAVRPVPIEAALEPQIGPAATTYVPRPQAAHQQLDRQEVTDSAITHGRQASVRDAYGPSGLVMVTDPAALPVQSPRNSESSTDTSAEPKPMPSGPAQAPLLASTSQGDTIAIPKGDNFDPLRRALDGSAEGLAPVEQLKTGHSLAEPGRAAQQLDIHGPRTVEVIVTAARALGDRPVELTLNPEELGRVRMTLLASDDGMTVQLTVERPETLDLLRRNIDILASDLRKAGYEQLSFGFAGDPRSQESSKQHHTNPVAETLSATETNSDLLLPISVTLSSDGLDLRI